IGDDVAAERRAHVVAAARAHGNALVEPERVGSLATERPHNADRRRDRWERALPIASLIDRGEDLVAVPARADVEVRGARGIAGLGDELPGQPEIQVVVRQTHSRRTRVRVRIVRDEPRDLRRGVTREDEIADQLQYAAGPTELSHELVALQGGRRIVPELRRSDRTIALVQAHQPVLLPGNTDTPDLEVLAAQRVPRRGPERIDPPGGVSLARSLVALDQLVRPAPDWPDLAGRVIPQHHLCGLRAAVDAEEDPSHRVAVPPGVVTLREGPCVLAAGRTQDAAGEVIGLHVDPAEEARLSGLIGRVVVGRPPE